MKTTMLTCPITNKRIRVKEAAPDPGVPEIISDELPEGCGVEGVERMRRVAEWCRGHTY